MKSAPELRFLAKDGDMYRLRLGDFLRLMGLWLAVPFYHVEKYCL